MKKLLLSLLALVFVSGLSAQTFSFGARTTPMISWSKVESTDDFDFTNNGAKLGFSIGPSLKTNLSDNFNIEVGLLFSWQGNKFNQFRADSIDYNYDIRRQYLHIPVTANGNIPLHRYFDAVMTFGVMPSIQLSSIADITDNVTGEVVKPNYDIPGSYGNFYLIAGAGGVIHLTREVDFAIGAKYNHGTIDAWFDRERNTYIKELTEKHHFVSVDLGLYIKF
jgi:hypothetical protein